MFSFNDKIMHIHFVAGSKIAIYACQIYSLRS